jgi:thioesterase domain-containing protein/NAD(P)-dependent dehydrogenase (short-subunit alcohol dehydrogenase family)/acyl carrier protein
LAFTELEGMEDGLLPFSWQQVACHRTGPAAMRVKLSPVGSAAVEISVYDAADGGVLTHAAQLVLRPVQAAALSASSALPLYDLQWRETEAAALVATPPSAVALIGMDDLGLTEALEQAGTQVESYVDLDTLTATTATGGLPPKVVLAISPPEDGALPVTARRAANETLALMQSWLASDTLAGSRLVFVTSGAVAVGGTPLTDVSHAATWGLVRAAQNEHPDVFSLVDIDGTQATRDAFAGVLASGEPQLAVRGGAVSVPHLAKAAVADRADGTAAADTPLPWDGHGTVLITGGTGALGKAVARHLVTRHGVRGLILTGRRGAAADGVAELRDELASLGATVTVAACDAADRDQLAHVIAGIPAERPLTGVIHMAGVLDDGVIASLAPERIDTVFRPKVDALVNLDELTRHLDLSAFVVFSSAAGVLGGAGQGNYSAANAFLDAFTESRRREGRPFVSLAWGPWSSADGMTANLADPDRTRTARTGVTALSLELGLEVFDEALRGRGAVVLPLGVDLKAIRNGLQDGTIPPLLRALVPGGVRRRVPQAAGGSGTTRLKERLAAMADDAEREKAVVVLVRAEVAAVLGHAGVDDVPADHQFVDSGFDSLSAVELRNRLGKETGLRLPATLVFDHATPADLAKDVLARLNADDGKPLARSELDVTTGTGSSDYLSSLYLQASQAGKWAEIFELLYAVAALRPSFSGAEAESLRPPVLFARGPARPRLYCFSSCLVIAGIQGYARFASAFRGVRNVSALACPGFNEGEKLPASIEAVTEAYGEALLKDAGDDQVVLLGSSAGGWFANCVAGYLERAGKQPAAVILVDTYSPKTDFVSRFGLSLMDGMTERENVFVTMSDQRLSAMGWYLRLFRDWEPEPTSARTLLVRATEPLSQSGAKALGGDWRSSWAHPHEVMDVRGDHFSILEEHSQETAKAINDWITRELGADRD